MHHDLPCKDKVYGCRQKGNSHVFLHVHYGHYCRVFVDFRHYSDCEWSVSGEWWTCKSTVRKMPLLTVTITLVVCRYWRWFGLRDNLVLAAQWICWIPVCGRWNTLVTMVHSNLILGCFPARLFPLYCQLQKCCWPKLCHPDSSIHHVLHIQRRVPVDLYYPASRPRGKYPARSLAAR